jgi:hypothetical protein
MAEVSSGPLATMAADRQHAIRRLRLVRRIGQALRPLESDLTVRSGENSPLPADYVEIRTIRTDLILQSLDLRLRIVALPGCPASALDSDELREPLAAILMEFPETTALVLVADEDSLPSRIVEPSDLFGAVGTGQPVPEARPLRELTHTYMRRVSPGWSEPDFIAGALGDLTAEARAAATAALVAVQSKRTTKKEAKEARTTLAMADADALAAVVTAALSGDPVDDLIDDIATGKRAS